jgi:hypothetical protein
MLKDSDKGLDETRKKRKRNEKGTEAWLTGTPKAGREIYERFQNSPCKNYFENKENNHWEDENQDPNARHERIFAPCILQQQHDSPSKWIYLGSPIPAPMIRLWADK